MNTSWKRIIILTVGWRLTFGSFYAFNTTVWTVLTLWEKNTEYRGIYRGHGYTAPKCSNRGRSHCVACFNFYDDIGYTETILKPFVLVTLQSLNSCTSSTAYVLGVAVLSVKDVTASQCFQCKRCQKWPSITSFPSSTRGTVIRVSIRTPCCSVTRYPTMKRGLKINRLNPRMVQTLFLEGVNTVIGFRQLNFFGIGFH